MKKVLVWLVVSVMLLSVGACSKQDASTADKQGVSTTTTATGEQGVSTTTTTTGEQGASATTTTVGGQSGSATTTTGGQSASGTTQAVVTDAPTFAVDGCTVTRGDTFTVAVRTENNPGIVSFRLALQYDPAVLELVTYTEQDFTGITYGPVTKVPFILNWVDAIHPDNTTDGVITTLTFRVKEDAPLGDTSLTLTYDPDDVFNAAWDNVTFATRAATVRVG